MGLMRFPRIKNAPHVKLWVGEMAKFGLSDLVKTVDSEFGTTPTVKLEFTGETVTFWVCSVLRK